MPAALCHCLDRFQLVLSGGEAHSASNTRGFCPGRRGLRPSWPDRIPGCPVQVEARLQRSPEESRGSRRKGGSKNKKSVPSLSCHARKFHSLASRAGGCSFSPRTSVPGPPPSCLQSLRRESEVALAPGLHFCRVFSPRWLPSKEVKRDS